MQRPAPRQGVVAVRQKAAAPGHAKQASAAHGDEAEGPARGAVQGATVFRFAGNGGQSSGQDGGGNRGGRSQTRFWIEADTVFGSRSGRTPASVGGHLAHAARDLPQSCAEHHARHGSAGMLPFLRGAMLELLPRLVHDLADKLQHLSENAVRVDSQDAIKPVREVCDEFLSLMRPLYGTYAQGPYLLDDAREILCAAQGLLADEERVREATDRRFSDVMTATVRPLLAILIMSSFPRPRQSGIEAALAGQPAAAIGEVAA